jgi:hypothetical protein
MHKFLLLAATLLVLAGCVHEAAIPLGNDMMEIDVSAAPIYGRAGAMDMALKRAANATLKAGYDKFIVMNNNGWNENSIAGGSYGTANANTMQAQAQNGSAFGTLRNPEVKMVIRMYHDGDKGSAKAVDAREVVKQP